MDVCLNMSQVIVAVEANKSSDLHLRIYSMINLELRLFSLENTANICLFVHVAYY